MNRINEFVASVFGWQELDTATTNNDDDGGDADEDSLGRIGKMADIEYAKVMLASENFQLDAKKNVFFIIVEKKEWAKAGNYRADEGVRLFSQIPYKEFSNVAFRHEITNAKSHNGAYVHESISDNCQLLLDKTAESHGKLITSKIYEIVAIVPHDDPVSQIVEDIAYSKKPIFRKGIVTSSVVDGMRSVTLNREIDKLRDLYFPVRVCLKVRPAANSASHVCLESEQEIVEQLKAQAKKLAIEEKSKLEKIKL